VALEGGPASAALQPVVLGSEAEPAAPAPAPAAPEPASAAPAAPRGPEPLYTLDARQQDAESLIMAFAQKANISVTLVSRYSTRISVRFKDLPFERAFRRLLMAADLTCLKDEDGYFVGLPTDLKVAFPDPKDTVIDATYRCRRTDAETLVQTIKDIMGDAEIRAAKGPAFLTPEVDANGNGTSSDSSLRPLRMSEKPFRTHDVVFTGPPDKVMRALSLARKFDRPRKQVRVNVKIVQVSTSYTRNLGVDWMDAANFAAVEAPSGSSSTVTDGVTLGRFNHTSMTLSATLNAMENTGNGKVLSNPTLLVLDGEKGFILSGTKYVYPKLVMNSSTGQPVYEASEQKLGVYLQVSVQVGLDDDMVMSIYPQVSSLKQLQNINGSNYPVIATQEEQATVRAVKGDVIVLGGLTLDNDTNTDSAVPLLGKIPILGKLFSSHQKTHETEELMFFLTPEIIDEDIPPLKAVIESRNPAPAE
jgi:type II secretory pathway component GspD/PulD (secretin)